ncbi:MAG TPA: tannase/feruloyl esterase family alpha/beta hydrolase [Casimicrobiaceae bacterium]|nr:tannase/feruloyl esterase family alpha/beta hydrolase [Casimicrobiaceae bacterium]
MAGDRHPHVARKFRVQQAIALGAVVATAAICAPHASAQMQKTTCDAAGIGAVTLVADGPTVTIQSAAPATAGSGANAVPYCLVKVLVPNAPGATIQEGIHIWVGLPMNGHWNGRWQSLGGGGYAGSVSAPTSAVQTGYAGATTDTGHSGGSGTFGCVNNCAGNDAQNPGSPDIGRQEDFANRSEHLMAVLGKQLVNAFYGQAPVYSYWNGCSTGGRQGLRMAQDYPADYDGILAGAPAIHWDRFQAGQIWYQLVQYRDNGGPIGGGNATISRAKENLATTHAVAACDAQDGVVDGVLTDPRTCEYSAAADATITRSTCTASDSSCLTPTEASAIDKMWKGPVSCSNGHPDASCPVPDFATRQLNGKGNKRLWYPDERGTDLSGLGGVNPFPIAVAQPRFWVYFDPTWDWQVLGYDNYLQFFTDTVNRVGPLMASDNPDLSPFRNRGGKLVMWHGFADQLIVPEGTIDYYDAVTQALGGGYKRTQEFARLFMAPGVGHCGGGNGPQPQAIFDAVVNWVEKNQAPEQVLAAKTTSGVVTQTRPLCPYPTFAHYTGSGSTDDDANFVCQ